MNSFIIIKIAIILLLLSACGKAEQDVDFSQEPNALLSYSSPTDNQKSVDIDSGIVLTFSHSIVDESLLNHVQLLTVDGESVEVTVGIHPANSKMVTIVPVQSLNPGQIYYVDFSQLLSEIGVVSGGR